LWEVKPPKNASADEKKQAEQMAEWLDDIKDFEHINPRHF
jgi:phage gp29-like protein